MISLREANDSDCEDLWKWRNDKQSRKMALDKRFVEFTQHHKWFEKILNSDQSIIYIGIVDSLKVGMVRFDNIDKVSSKVSINLNPDARGRKISQKLLRLSIKEFIKNNKRDLMAEIFENNIPSIKIFERNNFTFVKKEKEVLKYVFSK